MEKLFRKIFGSGKPPESKAETPFKGVDHYQYFSHAAERNDIYHFCKEFTEYLAKSGAKNVFFIDRSARPAWVGVHEYWKTHYPDKDLPGLYFINPDVVGEDIRRAVEAFQVIGTMAGIKVDAEEMIEPRNTADGQRKFEAAFASLMDKKDEPVVLFDTCSHTGRTLVPLISMIKATGFTDVRVITATEPNMASPIETDKQIDRRAKLHSCYPFGRDTLVRKGDDAIAERNPDANVSRAVQLRREIRQIMRDGGK